MHLIQPPLGGCVLKPKPTAANRPERYPAAFRRLCVETASLPAESTPSCQPPLGGCVLKLRILGIGFFVRASRL